MLLFGASLSNLQSTSSSLLESQFWINNKAGSTYVLSSGCDISGSGTICDGPACTSRYNNNCKEVREVEIPEPQIMCATFKCNNLSEDCNVDSFSVTFYEASASKTPTLSPPPPPPRVLPKLSPEQVAKLSAKLSANMRSAPPPAAYTVPVRPRPPSGGRYGAARDAIAGGGSAAAFVVLMIVAGFMFKYWSCCKKLFGCSAEAPEQDSEDELEQQKADNAKIAGAAAAEDVDVEMQGASPSPGATLNKAPQPTEFEPQQKSAPEELESAPDCPPGHTMMKLPNGQLLAVPDGHTVMQGVDGEMFFEPVQAMPPSQDVKVPDAKQTPVTQAMPQNAAQDAPEPPVDTSKAAVQPPASALECPPGHTMMRLPNGEALAVPDGHTVMRGVDGIIFFEPTR